jgi:hypothetical protein
VVVVILGDTTYLTVCLTQVHMKEKEEEEEEEQKRYAETF